MLDRRRFLEALALAPLAGCCGQLPPVQCRPDGAPRTERLCAYDNLHCVSATVHRPCTPDALRRVVADALAAGRKLTVRGGGMAIDAHSLNADAVVSLDAPAFARIGPVARGDGDAATITVGANARWGDVVRATAREGFMPYVVPSASAISAGGSLAAHSISRFSPVFAKEGDHVAGFAVLLADGREVRVRKGAAAGSLEERLFLNAVSGFGFLGVITEVEYELLRVAPPGAAVQVATLVEEVPLTSSWAPFLESLRVTPPAAPDGRVETVYATLWWDNSAQRRRRAVRLRSRYTHGQAPRPMIIYEPRSEVRIRLERLLIDGEINRIAQDLFGLLGASSAPYVNAVDDFTFYQDANVTLKRLEGRCAKLTVLQETYVLPEAAGAEQFLRQVDSLMAVDRPVPTVVDMMYVQPDHHPFGLSATNGRGGYAVTFTYLRADGGDAARVRSMLREIATECTGAGGRVHLVKSVEASREADLEPAYRAQFRAFLEVKRELDPTGMFTNEFFHRLFG